MQQKKVFSGGYVLLEVILAAGLVVIVAAIFVQLAIGSFGLERSAKENTVASNFAQEGLEAVRSIADRAFSELIPGTYGLDVNGNGVHILLGTSNDYGMYSRVITVEQVMRNSGDIVESGGTDDPDTRLVVSTVTWTTEHAVTNSVVLKTYFTRWRGEENSWDTSNSFNNGTEFTPTLSNGSRLLTAAPLESMTALLTKNVQGSAIVNDVAVDKIRDRLYVALQDNGANAEFLSYDISDISHGHMTLSGSLNLAEGIRKGGLALGKNYAYVAIDSTTSEIIVIRLRDMIIVQNWFLPTTSDTTLLSIALDEATEHLYVGREDDLDTDAEFFVVNTANPEGALSVVSSASIGANVNDIAILNNFAYLATNRFDGELYTVNLQTTTPMTTVSCDIPGILQDAVTAYAANDRLFIGRTGGAENEFTVYAIDPANPGTCGGAINLVGSMNFGTDDIFAMSIDADQRLAFFSMNHTIKEIRVVTLWDFAEVGNYNLVGDKCDAITYLGAYLYAGCRDSAARIQVLEGSNEQSWHGTVTSKPFDSGAGSTTWKSIWWNAYGSDSNWITFRIRTANSLQNLKNATWVGGNGTMDSLYTVPNGNEIVTDPQATGTQFIQWKATFGGAGTSSFLDNVSLSYQ